MNDIQSKKVSIPLAIGILLIPLIFSWVTLQKGYSKTAKIISFSWLVLGILFYLLVNLVNSVPQNHVASQNVEAVESKKEQQQATEKPKAVPKVAESKEKSEQQEAQTFTPPEVDYTKPVAKVSLDNDKAILKAAGKPVIEKENASDGNGEPQIIYFFSSDNNGLEIALSRTEINVAWQYDRKDPKEATAIFEDGQQLTRALLGGEGAELYEAIAKGQEVSQVQLRDGTVVKSARCGDFRCRYKILR
ncbi:hypothetical protein [Acinetobacter sp. ANC 5502]